MACKVRPLHRKQKPLELFNKAIKAVNVVRVEGLFVFACPDSFSSFASAHLHSPAQWCLFAALRLLLRDSMAQRRACVLCSPLSSKTRQPPECFPAFAKSSTCFSLGPDDGLFCSHLLPSSSLLCFMPAITSMVTSLPSSGGRNHPNHHHVRHLWIHVASLSGSAPTPCRAQMRR